MSTLPPERTTTVVPELGGVIRPAIKRRRADGSGTLDDELGAHEQHHHGVGDLVLADGHDLVDVALDETEGDPARPFHGDAVGERRARRSRPPIRWLS